MSQHDFDIAAGDITGGTSFRTAVNAALQALASNSAGTTEPTTMYPYQPWADTTSGFMKFRNAANSAWISAWKLDGSAGGLFSPLAGGSAQAFATGALTVTGVLAVNTAAGASNTIRKDIAGNYGLTVFNGHASTPYGVYVIFDGGSPDDTTKMFLSCEDTTNQKAAIFSNGTFASRTSIYGGISDLKLKTDISDATNQWEDVKAFRFRKYRFKDDLNNNIQLGVIAQELELTSPGLVDEAPDRVQRQKTDESGKLLFDDEAKPIMEWHETGETTKSVKYSIMYTKGLIALQEAMARIEQLEQRLSVLEVVIPQS